MATIITSKAAPVATAHRRTADLAPGDSILLQNTGGGRAPGSHWYVIDAIKFGKTWATLTVHPDVDAEWARRAKRTRREAMSGYGSCQCVKAV